MLGAELGNEEGNIIGGRVLDAEGPKVETTFTANGNFRGVETKDF